MKNTERKRLKSYFVIQFKRCSYFKKISYVYFIRKRRYNNKIYFKSTTFDNAFEVVFLINFGDEYY